MDTPVRMTDRRLQDLNTTQPNQIESFMAPQATRDVHNHAPELGSAPMKRKGTAITLSNPLNVDDIIR